MAAKRGHGRSCYLPFDYVSIMTGGAQICNVELAKQYRDLHPPQITTDSVVITSG